MGIDGVAAFEDVGFRSARAGGDFGDQRNELVAEGGEDDADFGGEGAGFVLVEECIVADGGVAEGVGFLALELDGFGEERLEFGEVVGGTGFGPDLLTEDGGAGELFDEGLGELGCFVVVALQIVDDGAGVAVGILGEWGVGECAEPVADLGLGLALVDEAGEVADLLGAVGAAERRHLRALVPFEELLRGGQEGDFADVGAESVVGLLR